MEGEAHDISPQNYGVNQQNDTDVPQQQHNGHSDATQTSGKAPGLRDSNSTERNPHIMAKDTDQNDEMYRYGWCGWTPSWLQRLNRPVWLLVFLCIYCFLQGLIVNGFINVVISTLEKRFDLPSKKTGLIASTYDISSAVLVVFIGYFGGRNHKARWIAIGCVIMAVGSLVFAIPHFTSGTHSNASGSLVCDKGQEDCQASSSLSNYFYVFILSQVLHGIGVTPLYSIGVTLLDESVDVHQSKLYLAIFYTISGVGPGAGYVIGGAFLNIYTDIGKSVSLTAVDPGWIGAWWLGFIIGGIVSIFAAIPIFGFPFEFPNTRQIRDEKVSQAHKTAGHDKVTSASFGDKLSDMPHAIKYLLMNPAFVFLVITGCSEGMIVSGVSTFGPKMIETQFSKTASEASLLFGICAIPGIGIGVFLGGYLSKRWKLEVRGLLKFSAIGSFMSLIAVTGFLTRCPQENVVGVNIRYDGNMTTAGTLTNDCNAGCGCTMKEFNPICGDNGLEYFDACFAGCNQTSSNAEMFSGCSCLQHAVGVDTKSNFEATAGKCPADCNYLPLFLIALFVMMVSHFLASIPGLSAILRCVPESQRSLAIGVQWICIRALGTIPGPIVYGAALDHSCILWQKDCNGDEGSCFLYSGQSIAWRFFLLGGGFTLLTITFFLLALWVYKSPDPDEEGETVTIEGKETKYDATDEGVRPDMNRMVSSGSRAAIVANESLPAGCDIDKGYNYVPDGIINEQINAGYDHDDEDNNTSSSQSKDNNNKPKDVLHISSV